MANNHFGQSAAYSNWPRNSRHRIRREMQAGFVPGLNKHRVVAKKKRRATACQVGRQKPDELARAVLRLAMEGERDPVRLHDGSLDGLLPAAAWREASHVLQFG